MNAQTPAARKRDQYTCRAELARDAQNETDVVMTSVIWGVQCHSHCLPAPFQYQLTTQRQTGRIRGGLSSVQPIGIGTWGGGGGKERKQNSVAIIPGKLLPDRLIRRLVE